MSEVTSYHWRPGDGIASGSSSNYAVTPTSAQVSYVAPTGGSNSQISTSGKTLLGNLTGGGGLAAGFDGTTSQAQTAGAATAALGVSTSGYNNTIGVDWGSGVTNTVVEFKVYGPNNNSIIGGATASTLKLQGSNDNSAWTDLTTDIATSGSNAQVIDQTSGITTTTAYRYHRININGNGVNTAAVAEIQFFEAGAPNNMTLVTTAQTVASSVGNGRVLLEFDNTATPTLNTDLTVEITADGGANWEPATLSLVTANSQAGRYVAETADTAIGTSGTSFAARIKTLNNKNIPIYGVAIQVH